MTTLHVRTQGAVVQRDQERIRISHHNRKAGTRQILAAEPIHTLQQLVLYGNIQITTQAMALLLHHDVDVVFLNQHGAYRGRLGKDGSRAAALRLRQLELAGKPATALPIAIAIVQAKLVQQQTLLQSLAAQGGGKSSATLQRAAQSIAAMHKAVKRARDLDSVRGHEGRAAASYFGALRALLAPEWQFEKRAYHPPPDPFNALLSFGYALLLKDVESAIHKVGLDPYLGFLHSPEDNRPSLALDLMEEFRPLLVDWAMLNLVLDNTIQPASFVFTQRPTRPVEIGPRLLPTIIGALEARRDHIQPHRPTNTHVSLRRMVELQAQNMRHAVQGDDAYRGCG